MYSSSKSICVDEHTVITASDLGRLTGQCRLLYQAAYPVALISRPAVLLFPVMVFTIKISFQPAAKC
jgi:hypothetical protein